MGIFNRKQRRASFSNKKDNSDIRALHPQFASKLDELAILGGFANHVSMNQTGLPTRESGSLASMVFAKCCAHARSIGAISVQSSMFDHHTIMSLARMILEGTTMIGYLLDPVEPDEWSFRYTLLRLHDTGTRIKLLRGFDQPSDDLRAGFTQLKAELELNPIFNKLEPDRKRRLLSGEEIFAMGMRSVATKIVGWEEKQFIGVYAYFSAHTHSAPMSFMRMADHKIDYFVPSETQTGIAVLPMEVTIACLRRSMLRMIDRHPEQISEYQPELLTQVRNKDKTCTFFVS